MKPGIVKTTPNKAGKSKNHIKYEKLLAGIEQQRQLRSNLQDGLEKAYAKINSDLSPLEKERNNLNRDYIIRLDELVVEIGIGKFNREWLESYMMDELDQLLDFFGHQDKVLSGLYEKYGDLTIDDIIADEDVVAMAQSLGNMFGFKVDTKEMLEKGQKAYFEEYQQKILENLKNNSENFEETGQDQPNTSNKSAKKSKDKEETVQLAKDARSIYMRLIKKFHPDLEKDPEIRDQKTEIVKQVTKAYQENDFFALLKLQITHIEDNEAEAEMLADDMLKRYNKILKKQLDELDDWIHEAHFTNGNIIADLIDKNGKFSPQKFAARKRDIEKDNNSYKATLADSKKRPKGWFKDQISMIKDIVQQDMMQNIFADMFGDIKF